MSRNTGDFGTAELDPRALSRLLDVQARDPKPTAVMHRDELLSLVEATAPVSVHRDKLGSTQAEPIDTNISASASPLIALAIIGVLIGMFIAIVATN